MRNNTGDLSHGLPETFLPPLLLGPRTWTPLSGSLTLWSWLGWSKRRHLQEERRMRRVRPGQVALRPLLPLSLQMAMPLDCRPQVLAGGPLQILAVTAPSSSCFCSEPVTAPRCCSLQVTAPSYATFLSHHHTFTNSPVWIFLLRLPSRQALGSGSRKMNRYGEKGGLMHSMVIIDNCTRYYTLQSC